MLNRFVYEQLQTSDPKRAKDFYSRVFNWSLQDDPAGDGPPYTEIITEGEGIGGIMPLAKAGTISQWLPYVSVDDVDVLVERAKVMGASVLILPMDIPQKGVRISVLADPTGAAFAVRRLLGG